MYKSGFSWANQTFFDHCLVFFHLSLGEFLRLSLSLSFCVCLWASIATKMNFLNKLFYKMCENDGAWRSHWVLCCAPNSHSMTSIDGMAFALHLTFLLEKRQDQKEEKNNDLNDCRLNCNFLVETFALNTNRSLSGAKYHICNAFEMKM